VGITLAGRQEWCVQEGICRARIVRQRRNGGADVGSAFILYLFFAVWPAIHGQAAPTSPAAFILQTFQHDPAVVVGALRLRL
jgi:hypothetical protein